MKTNKNYFYLGVSILVAIALLSVAAYSQKSNNALTDPEIASIAVTANQIDVNYGKIALQKSTNAEIRKFATTMIKDHESIIKQAVALATKLGVTPKDNPTTQSLLKGERELEKKFKSLKGSEFDKAYIENEVNYHEEVINTVKTTLIPQSKNEELKGLLTKVSPLLNHHYEMAKLAKDKLK